jgi:DNA-directed RNA polymerase subunit RPC12/RpoP
MATSVLMSSYQRRCDECRNSYEHVKGAPTGWCPECAKRMLVAVAEPPPADGYHLPYTRPFRRRGGGE